jgi:hypothetical protein
MITCPIPRVRADARMSLVCSIDSQRPPRERNHNHPSATGGGGVLLWIGQLEALHLAHYSGRKLLQFYYSEAVLGGARIVDAKR